MNDAVVRADGVWKKFRLYHERNQSLMATVMRKGRAKYEDKSPGPGKLVFPIVTYPLGSHCAVTGGFVYRGSAVPSARGRYFYGDNCSGAVWSLRVVGGKARSVRREQFRLEGLSSFGEDGRGELYAVTLGGTLYRLRAG